MSEIWLVNIQSFLNFRSVHPESDQHQTKLLLEGYPFPMSKNLVDIYYRVLELSCGRTDWRTGKSQYLLPHRCAAVRGIARKSVARIVVGRVGL